MAHRRAGVILFQAFQSRQVQRQTGSTEDRYHQIFFWKIKIPKSQNKAHLTSFALLWVNDMTWHKLISSAYVGSSLFTSLPLMSPKHEAVLHLEAVCPHRGQ